MVSRASLFLALRYLRPKRSFVSVITLISILGIAVGVLMMVVVRAVMIGFEMDFRETLMGAEPHILAAPAKAGAAASGGNGDAALPWAEALAAVRKQPGVVSAAPYAGGILYMAKDDYQAGGLVLGLPPTDAGPNLEKLKKHLLDGSLDLQDGTIVICDHHARQLGVHLGDEIRVYASQNVNDAVRQYTLANEEDSKEKKQAILDAIRLNPQPLRISGLTNAYTGGFNAYVSLKTGQDLFKLGTGITGIAIETTQPEEVKAFSQQLSPLLPGWKFTLWTDSGESRIAAMQNEQVMMQLVLAVIALVAAFSVMNTTITVTTQKRREIGVLSALGCRPNQVVNVFLIQATIVGFVGTLLGLGGGLLVLKFRNEIRELMTRLTDGSVHAVEGVFLSTIPAHVDPWDVTLTCLISLVLCIVAGLLPAWFASRMEAAVALRD